VRNAAAAAPAVGGHEFGLLIPGLGTTEIFDVISGELAGLARVHEYSLLWGSGTRPQGNEDSSVPEVEDWCEQFIRRQVSGVFFAPFEHIPRLGDVNQRLAERLHQAGIAVVLLDRDLAPFPVRSAFDLVGIDNFAGGYLMAQHLLKLGCPSTRVRGAAALIANGERAHRRHARGDARSGRSYPADFVHVGEPDDAQFVQDLAVGQEVDGIVCANDQTAAVLMAFA